MSTPAQRLSELGLAAKKGLGQHFLHDRAIVRRICDVAELHPDMPVVEIGPGIGILTDELARRAGHVIAIEKDTELATALSSVVPSNVKVRNIDALEFDVGELAGAGYAFVANLPYNVATAILRHFLDSAHPPQSCTFMVQREVAERMVARPPEMNILAVAMQFHGTPKIAFNVGRGAFSPPPRVKSAVVHMVVERRHGLEQRELKDFFDLVRAGFSARRKQLKNSFENAGLPAQRVAKMLAAAGIVPTVRPQQLEVADWVRIYRAWQQLRTSDEQ